MAFATAYFLTLENLSMKQYLDLLHKVREHGKFKTDRTGTGTFSIIGEQMRFNLADGFPLLTTKKVHLKSIIHELLWFLSGKTDVQYLQDNGVTIWDEWSNAETCAKYGRAEGDLGPIYGHQWRNFGATLDENGDYLPNGIDQISRAIDTIKNNPDSRRIIVTGWNPTEVDSVSLPPCHTLFQFFCEPLTSYEMLDYGTLEERLEYDEFSDSTTERYQRIRAWAKEKGHPTHQLSCQLYQRKPHCAFTA